MDSRVNVHLSKLFEKPRSLRFLLCCSKSCTLF
uniref:Uncharacterized protein n=1 Tax=Rhizophora mucronata TaxID=61149 RepID=A0A2P2R4N4_RHIMU